MINCSVKDRLLKFEDFLKISPPKVSFEFFPPKTLEMEKSLWSTIKELELLNPEFVSVTYGAGGSTRAYTHKTVKRIKTETNLTPAAHLTCVGAEKGVIDSIAREYLDMGVNHIVALRGDPPEGSGKYTPHPNGYPYCSDLIKGLKNISDFEISVAAFPEGHPESTSMEADLDFFKQKVDSGATRAITQYFFNTDVYFRFVDNARNRGVEVPIVPGIILISNFKQFVEFNKRCGASIPKWVWKLLGDTDKDPEKRNYISAMIAAEQCRILRENGVDQFHFYTLNRPSLATTVCNILGVKNGK